MPLDITFTLSDQDLDHFQEIIDKSKSAVADRSDEQIEAEAMSDDRLLRFVAGKPINRAIVIQQKLVNVVV